MKKKCYGKFVYVFKKLCGKMAENEEKKACGEMANTMEKIDEIENVA